ILLFDKKHSSYWKSVAIFRYSLKSLCASHQLVALTSTAQKPGAFHYHPIVFSCFLFSNFAVKYKPKKEMIELTTINSAPNLYAPNIPVPSSFAPGPLAEKYHNATVIIIA